MNPKRMNGKLVRWSSHRGGILLIVLVTMIGVAFLASQGVRLMTLSDLSLDQRIKTAQLSELLELGRMRLSAQKRAEEFFVEVSSGNDVPDRVGKITIEKKSAMDDGWRIIVRFPHNHPNELTVTWESP